MTSPVPELDAVLAAHVAYLRLLRRSERTVYERQRAVIRLATWLGANVSDGQPAGKGGDLCDSGVAVGSREPLPPAANFIIDATAADLAAWRASLTVGDRALLTYTCHVRELYRWAVREGLIEVSPAEGLPLPPVRRGLPRPISEDDLEAALACASPRVRPWLVLAGWAGLRAKEIALLRRECVLDTARPPVIIVAADATKGHRERVIPMSAFVLTELRLAGMPSSGFMFTRRDGRPYTPAKVSDLANACLHESGSAASLHQLRHRYATEFYRASGRDLRLTQDMLGHASPETTALYTKLDQADAAAAADAVPAPGRLRAVG